MWAGGIFGAALVAAARQLLIRSGGPELVEAAIEAAGAFLLTAGVGVVVAWIVYHFWQTRPPQRLHRMEDALAVAENHLSYKAKPKEIPYIRFIVRRFDKLSVPNPGVEGTKTDWLVYLPRIRGEAQAGSIEEARSVWPEIAKEKKKER